MLRKPRGWRRVVAAFPLGIGADRVRENAPPQQVAAVDLRRQRRDRHDAVHHAWVADAPHPRVHAAHRDPHHQPQAPDAEMLGDEAVFQVDQVAVAVARKLRAQAVAWLGGFAGAEDVGENQKVTGRIERAAFDRQRTDHRRRQHLRCVAARAVHDQHAVGDALVAVVARRAHRPEVQPDFGKRLAAGEAVVLDDVVAVVSVAL